MKCLDFMMPGGKLGGKLFNDSFSIFDKIKTLSSDYLNFNHVFIEKKMREKINNVD